MEQEEIIRHACNPDLSIVLEACAGSGKTWILVSRIVRLLLSGVMPHEILAITFTRKAAQEMKSRLESLLDDFQGMSDAKLQSALESRGLTKAAAMEAIPRARGLFEKILSEPRRISIDTFHGWFGRLCQGAPIGSGASSGGRLRDDVKRLQDEALSDWWALLGQGEGEFAALKSLYQELLENIPVSSVDSLLTGSGSLIQQRASWVRYTDVLTKTNQTPLTKLKHYLPLVEMTDPLKHCCDVPFDWDELKKAAQLLGVSEGVKDQQASVFILNGIEKFEQGHDWNEVARTWHSAFLTKDGTILKNIDKSSGALTKALNKTTDKDWLIRIPEIRQHLADVLFQRLEWEQQKKLLLINRAWISLGESMSNHYEKSKEMMRVQDFSDLESKAASLMEDELSAAYLQARLDARYKHILIDEFQDTNPLQWQILQAWLSAYGADAHPPKIFLVGDPKQSIYRFRKADARLFAAVRIKLESDFSAMFLTNDETRRNSPGVLDAVNQVFQIAVDEFNYNFRKQTTLWVDDQGRSVGGEVICMPLVASKPSQDPLSERHALQSPIPERGNVEVSQQHYDEIKQVIALILEWKKHKVVFDESEGKRISRAAKWDDFILLVRRKTYLSELEDAFRDAGIPFDSPRQGGLLQTLEADDLSALLELLLTPTNNLALAQTLRSPIFSVGEEELQYLAMSSEKNSWWDALMCADLPSLQLAHSQIQNWMNLSAHLPVHDLLDHIYSEGEIRRRYAEASPQIQRERILANLDAFLHLALDTDGGRYPSLSRFIHELRSLRHGAEEESPDEGDLSDSDGQDDTDLDIASAKSTSSSVRVMTIHSAKGLEAPFVILLDTNTDRVNQDKEGVLLDWEPEANAPHLICAYTPKLMKGSLRDLLDKENAIAATENWNLLYVAMTRAKQSLVLSGLANKKDGDGINPKSWYGRALQANITIYPYSELVKITEQLQAEASQNLIDEAQKSNPLESANTFTFEDYGRGEWRAPANDQADSVKESEREEDRYFMDLGKLVHLILERFTPVSPLSSYEQIALPESVELGQRFSVPTQLAMSARDAVTAILSSPELALYFNLDKLLEAWNELDVVDSYGHAFRIDRLIELEDRLVILDYKLLIPEETDPMFEQYYLQLRNYHQIVSKLRSDKKIEAYLLDSKGKSLRMI